MKSCRLIVWIGLALSVGLAGRLSAVPPKAETSNELERAWEAEIQGDSELREKLLRSVSDTSPAARWQLGQVEHDGEWIGYADLSQQWSADQTLAEYRHRRGECEMTYRDQLELANWCRSHGLSDRERAHLTVALDLSGNPNNPAIRNRLGYRLVDGEWRTQGELEELRESQIDFQKNLKTWKPKIQKLARMLGSSRSSFRKQAETELKAITDPGALPALEIVLGGSGLEAGKLLVEILGSFPSHRAADSLARLAVSSRWDAVRKDAIVKLRSRPFGSYVPELMATLRTPVATEFQLRIGAGGVHLFQQFRSETQTAHQVFDRRFSTLILTPSAGGAATITGVERDRNRVGRAAANAAIDAQLRAMNAQRAAEAQSGITEEWNERICEVLSEATGCQLPAEPEQWWSWWADYNQMTGEEKEYEYICYEETEIEFVEIGLPTTPTRPMGEVQTGRRPCECLVAGTPIWTDRGAVPVESVQVGDLVLSKHPETGELKYLPVMRATIRDEEPIMKVTTERGEIRSTGGHTFWISGQGWTKLRNVKPGQQFHGAEGPVEIQKLEDAGMAKTYNLLVADAHTYFVGPGWVLSHDVSMAEPVDALIPGSMNR